MICGKTYLYLRKKVNKRFLFAFVPARCKSWSCKNCRPIKACIVKNYVRENFVGDDLYMLTLTFFHSGTALDAWLKLGSCWNLLRTYASKRYGKFDYLRIVEPHKKGGWPHLHILIKGCKIDSTILKKVVHWGFGWNSQVTRISAPAAVYYISKYLSKNNTDATSDVLRQSSKCRVVSVSRGMPPIFTVKSEWDVVQYNRPSEHASFMANAIITILKKHNATFILCKPFSEGFIIESDVDVPVYWLDSFDDPYVWNYCRKFDYSYMPYGLQMELGMLKTKAQS